jgi:hypothetical protein
VAAHGVGLSASVTACQPRTSAGAIACSCRLPNVGTEWSSNRLGNGARVRGLIGRPFTWRLASQVVA